MVDIEGGAMTFLSGIQMVTTPFSLVAFALAICFYVYRAWLGHRRKVIESLPTGERAELVAKTLRLFDVDSNGLSRKDQYRIALEQIHAREGRFRIAAILVAFLAVLLAALTFLMMRVPDAQPAQSHAVPAMNRTGVGAFNEALFKQRPLELHGLNVRTEMIGTPQGQLFLDIGEVIPNCTPEGANGHVRTRLYGETDFEDGSHDTLLLRDFRRNPTNYKSPNRPGPVIGARVPTRIILVLEGRCGPEAHEELYPGEIEE